MNKTHHITSARIQYRQGFTLVETLVAIAVLMIAIAGPLVIATKGLTAALYSKDQMIASFLAQESMEVIKNIHDNNIAEMDVNNWLEGIDACGESSPCDAGGASSPRVVSCDDDGCPIYYSESSGYNANNTGSITQFKRRFWLEPVSSVEILVHVLVDWNVKSVPFETHLVSTMTAAMR
ncbi:MAG: hypothetical protein RLY66_589 [Candidatus Parcubacteria bacterium]|jgi:prepilin-type N-terminal cleavage/methylation domain-containing protein